MSIEKIKSFVAKHKQYRLENVSPAHTELKRLNLQNVPDGNGKWMFAMDAHRDGRYSATEDEIKAGVSKKVFVPFTDEERAALDNFSAVISHSNKMYRIIEPAEKLLTVLGGKKMVSKYEGESSFSGARFQTGTEIYYAKGLRTLVLPVSEVDEIAAQISQSIDALGE